MEQLRFHEEEPAEPWTDEQIEILAEVMAHPEEAFARLPEADQRRYEEAQQSVIDARRSAAAELHKIWII